MRAFFLGLNYEQVDLPDCLEPILLVFLNHMSSMEHAVVIQKKSKAFSTRIAEFVDVMQQGELKKTTVCERRYPIAPFGAPRRAPFLGDLRIRCSGSCPTTHAINIELCLNNIEAIGTNFLKLETIAESEPEVSNFGVFVCLTRELLAMGNWDKAYAEDLDYVRAFKLAYQPSLRHRFAVIQISPG